MTDFLQNLVENGTKFTQHWEGFEPNIYMDSRGNPSIGYGFNLNEPTIAKMIPADVKAGKRPMQQEEAEVLFGQFYGKAVEDTLGLIGIEKFQKLNPMQQMIQVDMNYNLGANKYRKFEKMHKAIQVGDMEVARAEMKNSDWYEQVGRRSKHHYGAWGEGTEAPIKDKPQIQNSDGSVSTEKSITIQQGDNFYNIPTIVNGKQLTPRQAIEYANSKGEYLGVYGSLEEAEKSARNRSNEIGKQIKKKKEDSGGLLGIVHKAFGKVTEGK